MNVIFPANVRRIVFIFTGWTIISGLFASGQLAAQHNMQVDYVNPFIGTAKSNVFTKWGNEGGTYPGAVAPWGYMQLTPETRNRKGYDYSDSTICYFSCLRHYSGFPSGSAGDLKVMPVLSSAASKSGEYPRVFSHKDETASPGEYSVIFRDNNTRVEATASERVGLFRFTFPASVVPSIFIGNSDRFHAAIRFSESPIDSLPVEGGYIVTFRREIYSRQLILRVSASGVSKQSAEKNIDVEGAAGFDKVRKLTRKKWADALSVISISDKSNENKTIFYTALYHTLLMPWIISDVDGNYRGHDGKVHTVSGRVAYGGFSPWDTFRSLHPLLSLLYPDKQRDMVLSMLDIYDQTGYLPIESMTGNHAVPVIVDAYLKGIRGIDSARAYAAMKKSIVDTPFIESDLAVFQEKGYIPFTYPESVTRSVEYAYDDWALAVFAGQVMHQDADRQLLMNRSYQYRKLFHPEELFILPRNEKDFKTEPGNTGYKEGDKWVYSYFVPQHPKDLVNLMGGDNSFAERLDSALSKGYITFDNETVFHVPYLFNAANAPHKTQEWVRKIMQTRFAATPGGLPGNDDLGAMSSWYVLSAMGIYPVAPGLPEYAIGIPAFDTLRVHLANGRDFVVIRRYGQLPYISALHVNDTPYHNMSIPHALIMNGGKLTFDMGESSAGQWLISDTTGKVNIEIISAAPAVKKVYPDDVFYVHFSLRNQGSRGTKRIALQVNGKEYAYKNCLVEEGEMVTDSIPCRLYRLGTAAVTLNGGNKMLVAVLKPQTPSHNHLQVEDLGLRALVRKGEPQEVIFTVKNTGWMRQTFNIPVKVINHEQAKVSLTEKVTLEPGEKKTLLKKFSVAETGRYTVVIGQQNEKFAVYSQHEDALLLDLSSVKQEDDTILTDNSGFDNHGHIIGKTVIRNGQLLLGEDCYVEVHNARSLDVMGYTITMMAWVYPVATAPGLVDVFTKGDTHVLQVSDGKTLTFFAGGWGRGDVSVPLPDNWKDHWHHIVGVCSRDSLRIYIDGKLRGTAFVEGQQNLSSSNRWTLGRNEEFPSQRIFKGYMDKIRVFATPLSDEDIQGLYQRDSATY